MAGAHEVELCIFTTLLAGGIHPHALWVLRSGKRCRGCPAFHELESSAVTQVDAAEHEVATLSWKDGLDGKDRVARVGTYSLLCGCGHHGGVQIVGKPKVQQCIAVLDHGKFDPCSLAKLRRIKKGASHFNGSGRGQHPRVDESKRQHDAIPGEKKPDEAWMKERRHRHHDAADKQQ